MLDMDSVVRSHFGKWQPHVSGMGCNLKLALRRCYLFGENGVHVDDGAPPRTIIKGVL